MDSFIGNGKNKSAPGPGSYGAQKVSNNTGGYIGKKVGSGGIIVSTNKYLGPGSYDITKSISRKSNRYGTFGKPKSEVEAYLRESNPGPG